MARGYQAFLELRWKESAYFEADGFFVTGEDTVEEKPSHFSRECDWHLTESGCQQSFGKHHEYVSGALADHKRWSWLWQYEASWMWGTVGCHGRFFFSSCRPFDFCPVLCCWFGDLVLFSQSCGTSDETPFLDCEALWSTIDRPQTQFHKPNAVPTQFQGWDTSFWPTTSSREPWREKRFSRTPPDGSILNLMDLGWRLDGERWRKNLWWMLWNI